MKHDEALKAHPVGIVMKAHQYLYYVKNEPVLSDYQYDKFCDQNDIFGGGGSDREADYSDQVKVIAEELRP